ncbi:MDR family MFS transporter [Periweissella beninensis]|uniref:MFS transporter n=1 Tax=Periweissella beninensis TaxID=504936 RepID=A0ABT0VK08_9LACO|nr:MFS transporter [Periweissella beninensis]MBM7543872.1 MFS family permease [Periweissella beninensis]MCM2436747.1 MFS transporter [Periweissella beninensis]MCT4395542.1 MFS transporter [Periweissella beninensis]
MKKVSAPVLVLSSFLNTAGSSFIWPLNTIFMHDYLHKSLSLAGLVLLLNSLVTLGGNYLGGKLFDKLGGYRTLLSGLSISIIALLILVWQHIWPTYPFLLAMLGFGSGITLTAINAYAANADYPNKQRLFNYLYVGLNLGVALGTALAGFLADINIDLIFEANLITCLLFGLLCLIAFAGTSQQKQATVVMSDLRDSPKIDKTAKRGLALVMFFYLISWATYSQWSSNIASHLTNIGISIGAYSFLWTINALVIVICLPLISKLIDKSRWFSAKQVAIGTYLYAISFLILLMAQTYTMFMGAIIILTVGEMLVFPAVPAQISKVTPPGQAGTYQSLINMASTAGKACGPYLGALLILLWHYNGLYILIAVILVLSLGMWYRGMQLLHGDNE